MVKRFIESINQIIEEIKDNIMKITKVKLQTDLLSIKLYIFLAFFSFIIPFSMVYWGEQFVPSGLTSVIFAVFPFFVILFSIFLFSIIILRYSPTKWSA